MLLHWLHSHSRCQYHCQGHPRCCCWARSLLLRHSASLQERLRAARRDSALAALLPPHHLL